MLYLINFFLYFLCIQYKTKTIKELKIKDYSGYFFEEMVNILDTNPECFMVSDTKECTDGTMIYNLCHSDKTGVPHIVFNNIDFYF